MTLDKSPDSIRNMFNRISKKYDFMNDVMSFGMQKFVKTSSIKMLDIHPHDNVIDLCCGTGDLARIIKKIFPKCCVQGVDFSESMLDIARSKSSDIRYLYGDVTNLHYDDNSFDFVIIGFGLRNILNAEKAVDEMYRILRPGGRFLHLDFGRKTFASRIYDILTPFIVKIFSSDTDAYNYLLKSKQEFPQPDDLIKDFEKKGFKFVQRKDFLFGVISAQVMTK